MTFTQFKITYFCIVICFFVTPLCPAVVSATPHDIPHHLRSASELNYPPFAIVQEDGKAAGFSVDLLQAVADITGHSLSFQVGPWATLKQQLAVGALDVLPLVSYSPERNKVYDFTIPYLTMHGTVFIRKNNKTIKTIKDLQEKEILVMEGDTAHEYVVGHNLSTKIFTTKDFSEAMQILSSGRHDAVVIQYLVGLQLLKQLHITNVKALETINESSLKPTTISLSGFQQKFCFAVPKGNTELLARLNEGLALVIANGTYEQLYNKWFTPILPSPPFSIALLLKFLGFIVLPALLLIALVGVWYFKRQLKGKTAALQRHITLLHGEVVAREKTNRENRQLLYTLDQTLDAVFIFRPDTLTFFYVNRGAINQLGYSKDELMTITPLDIKPEFNEEQFRGLLSPLIEGVKKSVNFETVHQHKNGRLIPVDIFMQCVDYEDYDSLVISIVRDITVRKDSEQEKIKLEGELQQVRKMEVIGVMAGGIAHDFNNILTAILGYGELALLETPETSQTYKDIGQILVAGKRAKALVKQILIYSRKTGHGKTLLKPRQIIHEALGILKATIPSSVVIHTTFRGDNVTIWGNATQLQQIILNLCLNASHAMAEKGQLTIDFEVVELNAANFDHSPGHKLAPGDYVRLSVTDTGTGISPEVLPKIFETFFTTKGVNKGTGIGLSVVQDLVTQHGGMIKVASEVGKGTKFTVFLPVSHDTIDRQDKLEFFTNRVPVIANHAHLLVVDDEEAIRQLYKLQLEAWGYQVTLAADGQFALDLFTAKPDSFDLILTDQTMPRRTGLELAKDILAIRPEMPIVLLSGYSTSIDPETVLDSGISCYVKKPVDMRLLLQDILQILKGKVPEIST